MHVLVYTIRVVMIRKLYHDNTSVVIAVPRAIRAVLGVHPGDYVVWRILGDGRVELATLERAFTPWRQPQPDPAGPRPSGMDPATIPPEQASSR